MSVIEEHRKRVGRNIKRARQRAGLSHDRLAQIVETSRFHLIRIEQGKHLPRPLMLAAIAAATETTTDALEHGESDDEEADPLVLFSALFERAVDVAVEKRMRSVAR